MYDAYDLVLDRIPRECDADDLAPLLNHIANWQGLSAYSGSSRRFAEGLITKSVASLDRSDIRDALTKLLIARFERDHSLFLGADLRTLSKFGLENPERRRQLVLALTKAWSQRPTRKILELDLPILREDIPWLFNQVADAKGSVADLLATVASAFAWQIDIEHKESLERAYAASAELRALLPPAEGTGIFDALRRLRAEAQEKQRRRMEEFASKRGHDSFDNEQRFVQALAACREGRLEAWTSLCLALSQPKTRHDDSAFFQTADVRELTGWVAASDELRTEIVRFAREFLLRVAVAVAEPRQIPADYFGLVYALSLHADRLANDPELLSAVRPVWILALLRHCTPESKSVQQTLASLTSLAPAIVADAYKHELRERWDRNELIFDGLLSFAWTPGTEAVLAETLQATPLQPQSYTSGLQLLVRQNPRTCKTDRIDAANRLLRTTRWRCTAVCYRCLSVHY